MHLFLLMVHIKKTFYIWYRKYWHLVQGKMAKKIVFGSDFMIYGAPFYKWCRFTYGAVTNDVWEKREARPILIILNYKYTRNIHYFNISLSYIFLKHVIKYICSQIISPQPVQSDLHVSCVMWLFPSPNCPTSEELEIHIQTGL